MKTLSNIIDPNLYDNETMSHKASYISTIDFSGQAMCAGLVTDEPAVVADDTFAVVRSHKDNFETVDTNFIDMACTNCPQSVNATAKLLLGSSLKTSYQSWNCDTDQQCNGACVVTSQVGSLRNS